MKRYGQTYSATLSGRRVPVAIAIVIDTFGVLARSTHVVGDQLNGKVQLSVRICRGVGEQRYIALLADGIKSDTEVDWSPVANWLAAISPLARLFLGCPLGIDVILCGCGLAEPLVVKTVVGASQLCRLARLSSDWNGLRLGTCIP